MEQFFKIYFWQFVSIMFNFSAIFIVTPFLSANQTIYGIYTLVIASYMFLSYADFGFLGAGMKFAAEYSAQKKLQEEIKIIGFTGFVFFVFVLVYALGIIFFALRPQVLISNLSSIEDKKIASKLLAISAISSPVFVMQRIVQIIFAVRLKDYILQRVFIAANGIKIIVAMLLFSSENYPIVTYFLISQLITLSSVVFGLFIAKKRFGYNFIFFFKCFKFSSEVYEKTKKIAFVSIFLTFCWILYYELDPFVISKLLGPNDLAIFAIGFTLMEYFRSIFGIVFGPFVAKFNHFIGLKDYNGLHLFFTKVLVLALPLTVFPILTISITIKNFIYCWVGNQYVSSVPIAQVMVLSFIFNFLSSPTGILIMAYEKAKLLYITNSLLPLIYWIGVFVSFKFIGLQALANFKFAAFFIVAMVYFNITVKLLKVKFWPFLKKLLTPSILPILFILTFTSLTKAFLPIDKNKINLLIYLVYNGMVILSAFVLYYLRSKEFSNSINDFAASLFKNNNTKLI